ncbi:MAG TPA: FKBP-type peptidyl-prolyl cis-trans isomerase [Homoserinimonas sp.]|nr:FKBP-type peptidyl-prolyl cis-trans isomerase [Homoserinimonas sp.]
MHKSIAIAAFASIALLLGACQSPPDESIGTGDCEPIAAGAASDAVEVRGGGKSVPSVRFDEALAPALTQRTVVEAGEGRLAESGSLVTFAYAAFNGATGDIIDAVGYESPYSQVVLNGRSLLAGFEQALLCTPAGSRIAAVIPPAEAFGDAGNEQYGISASDPVVLVIDVVDIAADRAQGERQPVMDSLPQVDVGATGEPQITIPPKSPPTGYSVTVLKQGEGEQVSEGATVTVEYRGDLWASGRTFDSSWYRDELVRMPTSSFLKGFGDALVGQTVGSQVLAIIPPEFGFGAEGSRELGIEANDTMVFVIDILAVVQPPETAEAE